MHNIKQKLFSCVLILLLPFKLVFSEEPNFKWDKFGVTWIVSNSQAQPRFAPAAIWSYTELSNYNSITSRNLFKKYDSYTADVSVFDRLKTPSEFAISFAVRSESQSWFYHIYAFKITGGFWGMNKVSFIHSDRLDKTKPFNTKNNTFVKELASAKCSVKYDKKMYNYRIAFQSSDVALYIDGKKVLSAPSL